jgi:hypothetical protein
MNPTPTAPSANSTWTMEDILESVVHVHPQGHPEHRALGLICGDFVLTCAHIQPALPVSLLDTVLFEVTRVRGGEKGIFALYAGSNLDVMALHPNSLTNDFSECDITEGSWELLESMRQRGVELRPSNLNFPPGNTDATIRGFFLSPDGTQLNEAEFLARERSPTLEFPTADMQNGCSGGPIITQSLDLIGSVSFCSDFAQAGRREGLARRYDLGLPMLMQKQMGWQEISIGT